MRGQTRVSVVSKTGITRKKRSFGDCVFYGVC